MSVRGLLKEALISCHFDPRESGGKKSWASDIEAVQQHKRSLTFVRDKDFSVTVPCVALPPASMQSSLRSK